MAVKGETLTSHDRILLRIRTQQAIRKAIIEENEPVSWIADEDLLNFHLKCLSLLLDDISVGGLVPAFLLPGDMQKEVAMSPDNLLSTFMLEKERNQALGIADDLKGQLKGAEDSLNQTLKELEASQTEAKAALEKGYNKGIKVATNSYTNQMPGIQDQEDIAEERDEEQEVHTSEQHTSEQHVPDVDPAFTSHEYSPQNHCNPCRNPAISHMQDYYQFSEKAHYPYLSPKSAAKATIVEQNMKIDQLIGKHSFHKHSFHDKNIYVYHKNCDFNAVDVRIFSDEDLNVCPTSERVSLHENVVEASEDQHIEIDPINGVENNLQLPPKIVQSLGDAQRLSGVSNLNGDIIVPYPHFVDFHPNGITWVVKARLVRMVEVFNQLLPHTTLILVLLDDQGDAMEASVGPEEVFYFREHLFEGRVYLFKGVSIVPADEKYNLVPYHYKMCFTDDTRVEHVYITCDRTPLHWTYRVRLQDIHHFAKNYVQLIDVVGLVVIVTKHQSTRNEDLMMRDVVLLDKSMTFVRLTLWNEFAMRDGMRLLETLHQNNILFATGLKVDDFHGPYLSTCKKSKLYVNQSIRTNGIPEWFAKDEIAQKSVAWNRTHGFSLPQALIISNVRRILINQFAFWANVNYYRVIGRIEKIYVEHLWIDLCNTCYNQVDNQYGWFMCKHCG
ncbi:uncharacterized protein LOC131306786 [Rhododendron vialii]|uniref:uncharacterized protein LOC131306786 n=1 Tax=Rhododendron vialii TaxID=182163 RepID=UPI00265E9377|nr:uncharacterized protein LOC131306786 [Rhododendron vialii]